MGAGGTLQPYICRYIQRRRRMGEIEPSTANSYWSALAVLDEVHGKRPLSQIGRATIERWREARAEVLKPSTMRTQWSMVSCFLGWLVTEGEIRVNPCTALTPPRRPQSVPRALEEADVAAILEMAPDARGRAVVWLMVGMGLRCVEVSRLNIEDWQRNAKLMRVVGKGRHVRDVPVPVTARFALESYLMEYPATSGPFLRSYRSNRSLRAGTLSHYLADWMMLAGVKHTAHDGRSAHALRHTAASDVLENCGDIRVVQAMLGHQHLSSSSVYLRRAAMTQMLIAMEGREYRAPIALAD